MTMTNERWWPRPGEMVLCAVSGGLDSMCLLHMLVQRCGADHVIAAHFNHQLRGEASDRDEMFVREYCGENGISFVADRGDVRKLAEDEGLSVEEAARELRYAFLRREAAERGGLPIYTAHHADDNAETMLLNLVRGTGIAGLTGMQPMQNGIYRPLLDVTRGELEEYAKRHGLPHVEDATNADPDAAARNLIRLQVMPLLRKLNPRAVEHMHNTAHQMRTIDASMEEEAARRTAHVEVQQGRVTLSRQELYEASPGVRPRMLLRLFDLLGVGRKDIGTVHLNGILELTDYDSGKERRLSLPHGVTARFSRGWLILETRPQPLTEVELLPNQPLRWGEYTLTLLDHPEGEGIALRQRTERESHTITAAPCVPGERLTLPGSNGARSIKRLCIDHRISLAERDCLPAIYTENRLAAVWRLGTDVEFLPEGTPCRFVQIIKETEEKQYEK